MQCGRIVAFLLIAVLAAASPGRAPAQSAVDRPVKVIVPLPAGSTSDVVARLIADRLRDDAGQVVVVENRPGASGRIAVDALRKSPADGATLLLAPIAVPVIGPLVFRNLSYDPAKDFAPIAQVAKYEFAFAVAADHPARTIDEFVAWARANPARVAGRRRTSRRWPTRSCGFPRLPSIFAARWPSSTSTRSSCCRRGEASRRETP
jgi:tripartite-type tricarboxylate transporter receptor subunit TctC